MNHLPILCVAFASMMPATTLHAQTVGVECVTKQILSQQNNDSAQGPIASVGSIVAYTTDMDTLKIFNLSDPLNPVLLSQSPGLGSNNAFGSNLDMNATLVVSSSFNEIKLIDITDPTNPTLHSTISSAVNFMKLNGSQLIVHTGNSIDIYDVSNPNTPTAMGSAPDPSTPFGIALNGSTLCVADRDAGLRLFDISDPANITETALFPDTGLTWSVAAKNNVAVLMQSSIKDRKLIFVDISDPSNPTQIPTSGDDAFTRYGGIFLGDSLVLSTDFGVQILNTSNLSAIEFDRIIAGPDIRARHHLVPSGSNLAMLTAGEFSVIDLSIPSPDVNSIIYNNTPSGIASDAILQGMIVDGQLGFTTDLTNGQLHIIDLSEPASPTVLSSLGAGPFGDLFSRPIAYSNQVVFLCDASLQIRVIDVSDPMNPILMTTFDGWDSNVGTWGTNAYLSITNGHLYVNPIFGPMTVFDIQDPMNPTLVHTMDSPLSQRNTGLVVSADRLVGFWHSEGGGSNSPVMDVFDISVPSTPTALSNAPGFFGLLPKNFEGGANIDGNTLLVSVGDSLGPSNAYVGGMVSFDISDDIEMLDQVYFEPLVNSFDSGGGIGQIIIDGDTAYATSGRGFSGVAVFDISDLSNLNYIGAAGSRTPTASIFAAHANSKIYTTGANIMTVFDASACEAICPADLTNDGTLNFFDISAFLTALAAQDPVADFTDDGIYDFFDVSAFLQAFNTGCP